ncbi:Alpha/Beta hydrolase protein [Rhexocercosporidium sp. MPI-PUGE-AT-0058]|nr:Alpha/Beta hydrolase protein [Rhexocercosporidium sp. MPI-PUGE-AT-0058]
MTEALHPCCDSSSSSPIWEGKSKGKIISVDGIETYVSRGLQLSLTSEDSEVRTSNEPDEDLKRVILFLTEAHGIYLPNAQLLADSFASHLNCDVFVPDQFAGQSRLPKGETPKAFEEWKMRHEPPVTDPILTRIVKYIHDTYGKGVRIGGVGYCFGGRYIIRLMGCGIIDVGVVNHPSFFTMEEVEKLGKGKKLAMYAAEKDDILPPDKRRQTEDVLTSVGATWISTVFSGTEHGFSVRGDLSIKEVRLAKERAFKGAVEWFSDWL